jgi:hypothetical protein
MATTTTTTIARPTPTGRALAALLGGAIAVTAAYHATRPLPSQDPVTATPTASTATIDPFQVMGDLTPVVSAHLASTAVAPDPFVGDDASSFGEHGLTGFVQGAVGRLDQP